MTHDIWLDFDGRPHAECDRIWAWLGPYWGKYTLEDNFEFNVICFKFKDASLAMMFKLTFGGR